MPPLRLSPSEAQRLVKKLGLNTSPVSPKAPRKPAHKVTKTRTSSPLEKKFDFHWNILGGPELIPEFRFDAVRMYRYDRVHIGSFVAIEVEGGTEGGKGRHVSAKGYTADVEKYNLGSSLGWVIFRLTAPMLRDNPHGHLQLIIDTIHRRMAFLKQYGALPV